MINKVPHHKLGNFKRAKVPSYPKGKLGHFVVRFMFRLDGEGWNGYIDGSSPIPLPTVV